MQEIDLELTGRQRCGAATRVGGARTRDVHSHRLFDLGDCGIVEARVVTERQLATQRMNSGAAPQFRQQPRSGGRRSEMPDQPHAPIFPNHQFSGIAAE